MSAPELLDAILAAAQTGTPDPQPTARMDPEREARAQAWDDEVERVAEAIWATSNRAPWPTPLRHTAAVHRAMAAAALKAIEAERAGEPERDEHRVADDRGVTFDGLRALSRWIDEHPGNAERDPEARSWGRLAKLQEEAGEVVAAFIGCTGQNPRKGVTHTRDDVVKELLDVAITALGAVEHFTEHAGPSSLQLLDAAIGRVARRAGVTPARSHLHDIEADAAREAVRRGEQP